MDNELKATLERSSTATISTQLLKRGIRSCYMRAVTRLSGGDQKLIGPAYTLRYIPFREDKDALTRLADKDNPSRRAIEDCPEGSVLVVDARELASCGTLGDILATRLKKRGVAGFVSDGGVRDVDAVREIGLPIFCAGPAAPASANAHIAADTGIAIACGGVAVFPGDIIVADNDGVVVLPADLANEVAHAAAEQEDLEGFVALLVEQGRPVIGTYPPNDQIREEYQAWISRGRPR